MVGTECSEAEQRCVAVRCGEVQVLSMVLLSTRPELSAFLGSPLLHQGSAVHLCLGAFSDPGSWLFTSAGNISNTEFLQGSAFSLQMFLGADSHSLF